MLLVPSYAHRLGIFLAPAISRRHHLRLLRTELIHALRPDHSLPRVVVNAVLKCSMADLKGKITKRAHFCCVGRSAQGDGYGDGWSITTELTWLGTMVNT